MNKINKQMLSLARWTAEQVTGIALPFVMHAKAGAGLTVDWDGAEAQVRAEEINALIRGCFLLSRAVREGRRSLHVKEERHIASCGAMIDCSRNAVPRVETVKRTIDRHACLGLNLLMLYTEDTYEVPEYPRMGYLRGRYTQAELREMDEYAAERGVELVPCIQTLGHMGQFLQWPENAPLRDQHDVLLIDDERTYDLIEAAIRSVRACMRAKRIHIGMDEAHGVGLGQYYRLHGDTDRFALLSRHLSRVIAICQKYDFRPMMWSDMFFRLGSKTNEYYDDDAHVPQAVIDALPPVDMVYWDYYHQDEKTYDRMLTEHERMSEETVFAGGIWTWSGFMPAVKRTEATMLPALRACARHGVRTVLATMWGDDGAETNYTLGEALLPIFSEHCWQGCGADMREIALAGECLTGQSRAVLDAMGDFYRCQEDQRTGKNLIWCDPMFPLTAPEGEKWNDLMARFDGALRVLDGRGELPCRFAAACFDVAMQKAVLLRDLRPAYLKKDKAYLFGLAEGSIPALIEAYEELRDIHCAMWETEMKRFGWEVLSVRYGGAIARLNDLAGQIERYLHGEIPCIEELEEAPMDRMRYSSYAMLSTPTMLAPW